MKTQITIIASAWLLFAWSFMIEAQVVQKPAFQPGEWWELAIKTENATEREPFYQLDGEYRIEAVVAGFICTYKDAGKWTDNCGEAKGIILNALLGIGEEKYLSFPTAEGNRWKYSFSDSYSSPRLPHCSSFHFSKCSKLAGATISTVAVPG